METSTGLENIPTEILYQFLLPLSYEQIINFCRINRQYQQLICQNDDFWATKAYRDIGVSYQQFYNLSSKNSPLKYLLLLSRFGNRCVRGSEKIINVNTCLENASAEGNLPLVEYFMK